jgi:hypothetical protein
MVKCEQHCKVPITANALAVKIAKYFETEGVIGYITNNSVPIWSYCRALDAAYAK